MKFVKFGGATMHDCPTFILVDGKRISIKDGIGVEIVSGLIMVFDLFQLPGETFHRYRIRSIYLWDEGTLEFGYPPVIDVPAEAWAQSHERVGPQMTPDKMRKEMPDHWALGGGTK